MLSDELTAEQHALLGHLENLRTIAVFGDDLEDRFEASVLLIDIYEAILERHGILIYHDQEEVTEH